MKWIMTLLFYTLVILTYSQEKGNRSGELLDEVSAKVKSYKSIRVDFSYSIVNIKAKVNEERTGSLLVSGDKYKMNAAGRIIFSDGKSIWTYIESSNEVQIHSMEDSDDAMTPSKLLTSYSSNYKSKIIKEKNQDPNIEMIELIPLKQKNIVKAILGIDKARKQVKSFSMFDKSGSVYTYKINKFQTDVPVQSADFIFDASKFPGVDIEDMR